MPELQEILKSLRVWDTELPAFDPSAAPSAPLPLFVEWFAEAVAAGQTEPHTMSLATVDGDGLPDVRTVMLHGADEDGFHFASHAGSAKGRQLTAHPGPRSASTGRRRAARSAFAVMSPLSPPR